MDSIYKDGRVWYITCVDDKKRIYVLKVDHEQPMEINFPCISLIATDKINIHEDFTMRFIDPWTVELRFDMCDPNAHKEDPLLTTAQ